MIVKTINCEYGVKVNLGNYHSVNVSLSAWAEVEEDESEVDAINSLHLLLKGKVLERVSEYYDKMEPKTQEVYRGLPVDVQLEIAKNDPTLAEALGVDIEVELGEE